MRRILWTIPNLTFGGAQTALRSITAALANDFENHIAVFNEDGLVIRPHGTLHSLGVGAGKNAADKALRLGQRVMRLRNLKAALAPDVSVSFLEGADYVNVASRRAEAVACSIRGSKLDDVEISGRSGWLRKKVLMPLIYPRADMVITVSEGLRAQMADAFGVPPSRLQCIYNMYDVEGLQRRSAAEIPRAWGWLGDRPLVVSHGRLHVAKGYRGLISAFAKLPRQSARLLLIGDGPLRPELEQQCAALGLSHSGDERTANADVVFAGYQADPMPWLRRATVFALSSEYEGFPNALAEAMSLGIAVVSTDCPTGPREILAPGTGNARPLRDVEWADFGALLPRITDDASARVWADTLFRLIQDSELRRRYAAAASSRVRDFGIEATRTQWAELLSRLAESRKSRGS